MSSGWAAAGSSLHTPIARRCELLEGQARERVDRLGLLVDGYVGLVRVGVSGLSVLERTDYETLHFFPLSSKHVYTQLHTASISGEGK